MQFYCVSGQEALDTVLQAYRVGESVLLPAMVVIEAMYISHTLEPVEVPGEEVVARFLPPFEPERRLDPARPLSVGNTTTPAQWRANRLAMQEAMGQALGAVAEAGRRYGELTGRGYGATESYRTEDARVVLVAAGGMAGTAREAVDRLREAGVRGAPAAPLPPFRRRDRRGAGGAGRSRWWTATALSGAGHLLPGGARGALCSGQGTSVLSYIAGLGA